MHALMHMLFHAHMKTHIHTWFQLKDFGPIRKYMQANQGLFTDRKHRVSQGKIFVMEIWTAGVGKQSSGQDAPETTYFTHEITHTEEP